jgi:hypothetical protein
MDFLKSVFYSTRIWQGKRPRALELSILSKLPLELLDIVAQFLPLVSTVSFYHCCTPLYSVIDWTYLQKAKQGRFDTCALSNKDMD